MLAYTSFISDVHKSYRVEKLVLHYLTFLLIKTSKCYMVPNAILFHILLWKSYICNCDESVFGTNKHLLILKAKISGDAKQTNFSTR